MPVKKLLILSPIPEDAIRLLVGQRVPPGETRRTVDSELRGDR